MAKPLNPLLAKVAGLWRLAVNRSWPPGLRLLKPVIPQAALLCRYPYKIPYAKLVSAWFHGFYGDKVILYDFERFPHRAYLSDFARQIRTPGINRDFAYLLKDKIVFTCLLKGFGVPTPKIYAEQHEGNLVFFDRTNVDLESLIHDKQKVVIKPRKGSGGTGFNVGEWQRGGLLVNKTRVATLPDFGRSFIVSEFVHQHEYAARIYPGTTNTLRIITMWDYERHEPFVASAIHRFGTSRSYPVDNWGNGGLSADIDLETGILGRAAAKPTSNSLSWYESHPETGEPITGVKIPGWETMTSQMLSLARKLVSVPYVGWDLAVTHDGFVVIEGNHKSDVNLLQIHRPLLLDGRVAKFYRTHEVIRRGPSLEG